MADRGSPAARDSSEAACPKIQVKAEDGDEQLLSDLKGMLNNPLLSDLCLLCEDGVRVHASRMHLMARSDVLRQMLSNGMAESRKSEISLPDISSSALLPTLEYLYTGAITQYEMDLGTAILVLHAASFFNLPKLEAQLKAQVNSLLCASVPLLSERPAILAQYLSTLGAYGLTHLFDEAVNAILVCLRYHCCTTRPSVFLQHLSKDVMPLLLRYLQSRNANCTVFSFMEYVCIRTLLIWGASCLSAEAAVFFERSLPDEGTLTPHVTALMSSGKPFLEVGLKRRKTRAGQWLTAKEVKCMDELREFFGHKRWKETTQINLRLARVQPLILLTVLKPLNLRIADDLDSARLEEALQYQALHTAEMNGLKWFVSSSAARHYKVEENGAVVCRSSDRSETSLPDRETTIKNEASSRPYVWLNVSFSKPGGVHEIKLVAEDPPAEEMRIVVFCDPWRSADGKQALRSVGCFCHTKLKEKPTKILWDSREPSTPICWRTPLKGDQSITLVIDMKKRQCSIKFEGHDLLLEDLPGEVFLGATFSGPGKLRAALVSDHTFL